MGLRPNKFAGVCAACKQPVDSDAGFLVRGSRGWQVFCPSTACLPPDLAREVEKLAKAPPSSNARKLHADGRIECPYSKEGVTLLRSLPGARWDKERSIWHVSVAQRDLPRVLEVAAQLGLEIAPELVIQDDPATELALARAECMGAFPFQLKGVRFLATHDRALLGDEMGLGKTIQALLAVPEGHGVLVVCPAAVKYNWLNEAHKWRPDFTCEVLAGRGAFRWPEVDELLICNPEIVPERFQPKATAEVDARGQPVKMAPLTDEDRELSQRTVLIADEAHLYKNRKAARSQCMRVLSKLCAVAWPMTGTPLLNYPFDLWGLLSSFSMEREIFGSFTNFLRLFEGYKSQWGGYEWGTPSPEVPERMRRLMLRRTRDQVLPDLPRKQRQVQTVNGIDPRLKAMLDELYEEFAEMLEEGNLPPFERMSLVRAMLAKSRIPAMLEEVERYEEQATPVVVFSAHLAPIEELATRPGWAVIHGGTSPQDRDIVVRRFQAGELKGLGATIEAGGVGLTLTHARHELFVDLDWTPAMNIQAEDRCCRIGQEADSVHVKILTSSHELDKRVQELLVWKMQLADAAIDKRVTPPMPVASKLVLAEEVAPKRPEIRIETAAERDECLAEKDKEKVRRACHRKIRGYLVDRAMEPKEIDEDLKPAIELALDYMLSVCDGAVDADGMGFNKPDALRSRWIAAVGLEEPEAFRMAYEMLRDYHRQLGDMFPQLFED